MRKQKKIHYLYKTTCLITSRYYVGMHSTHNLNDGYMGSGKRLRYSIRKHGADNHIVEILEFFDSRDLLVEAEIKAITSDMINDNNCMNLTEGGSGGHGSRFLSKSQLKKGRKEADKVLLKKYGTDFKRIIIKNYRDSLSEDEKLELNLKLKKGQQLVNFNYNTFEGKTHTKESKQKMSEKRKGTGKGSTNSQFGKCWITNEKDNKKIMKGDEVPNGWRLGRIMK